MGVIVISIMSENTVNLSTKFSSEERSPSGRTVEDFSRPLLI